MKKVLSFIFALILICALAAIGALAAAPDQPVYPGYNYYVHYPVSVWTDKLPRYIKASFDYDRDFVDIVPDYPDTEAFSYNGVGYIFPLADENHGSMYDLSYTVDDTVITFEYRLKSGYTLDDYLEKIGRSREEGALYPFFLFDIAMKQKVVVIAQITDFKFIDVTADDGTVLYENGEKKGDIRCQILGHPLPNLDPVPTYASIESQYKYMSEFESWFFLNPSQLESYAELYDHIGKNGEVDWAIVKAVKKGADFERLFHRDSIRPYYWEFGNRIMQTDWEGSIFKFDVGFYSVEDKRFYDLNDPEIYKLDCLERYWTEMGFGRLIGDMDGDNALTVIDATRIQRCQIGVMSYPSDDKVIPNDMVGKNLEYYSDFDQDGERGIIDATAIQRYLVYMPYRCADWTPYPHRQQPESTESTQPASIYIPPKPTNPAPTQAETQPATQATEPDDAEYTELPQILSLDSTARGVEMRLSRVKDAEVYRVYRMDEWGNCTRIGETSGDVFIDDDVNVGENYTYTARCMNSDMTEFTTGYDHMGRSYTYMPQLSNPRISSAETVSDGLKLSWSTVDEADLYRVYRDEGSGWTKLGDTRDTSFTDTSAESGVTYRYTVRCLSCQGRGFASDFYDDFKAGIGYTPETQPSYPEITGFKSVGRGVEIHIGAVEGAEKYRFYYKNSNGGWTKLGETSDTVFIDDDVNKGKSYTYTVRCINSALTEFTSGFNSRGWKYTYLPQLDIPHITGSEIVAGCLKVKWGAVDGADLYRIYMKDDESWVKLGETRDTRYIDTALRPGQGRRYTVRCLSCGGRDFASGHDWGSWLNIDVTPQIESLTVQSDRIKLKLSDNEVKRFNLRIYRKDGGSWRRIGELPYEPKRYGEEENRYIWYDYDVEPGKTYTYTVRTVDSDGSFVSWYNTTGWSQKYSAEYYAPKLQYAIFDGVDKILVQAEENKFGVSNYLLEIWNNGNSGTSNITSEPVYLRFGEIEEGKTYRVNLTGLDESGKKITARDTEGTVITMMTAPVSMRVEKTGERKYLFDWTGPWPGSYADRNGEIVLISEDGEITVESGLASYHSYEFDLSDYPEDINWTCIMYNCTKDGISCSMPYTAEFRESDYN